MDRIYLVIDLKSFYASVECVDRGLDSLKAKLVVADPSRGKGTICLAVSPALKELGVKKLSRLYEIDESLDFIMAPPRMKRYMEMSSLIYSIYLKYVAEEDIHIYSVDECFIDITDYQTLYNRSVEEIAQMMIDDVYKTTGICATVGIGTNMFLAKIALDITAKHSPTHMGYLDEEKFKKELWDHSPITDFWMISFGTERRLLKHGITTMRGIAECNEDILYKEFGINAELLIDHANGRETCTIKDIKRYRPKSNSLSNSQVLFEDYSFEDAKIVLREMIDLNCLELIDKGLVCDCVSLSIGYSSKYETGYTGGSKRLGEFTQDKKLIKDVILRIYNETTLKDTPIRKIGLGFGNIKDEKYKSYTIFSDTEKEEKEKRLDKTILDIQRKFSKNAILKGVNLMEKATQRDRNKFIGGHRSGEN